MDPNETLDELRRLCSDPEELYLHAGEAADLFEALDGWITNGGFLPRDWAARS